MLIVFDAVCRTRSTIKAAEEINISQPAVSRYLKKIKDLSDQDLFVRSNDGLEPTQAGIELWRKATDILDLCATFSEYEETSFDPDSQSKEFTIAVPLLNTGHLLQEIMLDAYNEFPRIKINMINLHMALAYERLDTRDVDVYIGFKPDYLHKTFEYSPVDDVDFQVICSEQSPFYKKSKIDKEDFVNAPHIKVFTEINGSFLDRELKRVSLMQKNVTDVPDMQSMLIMLRNSDNLFLATKEHAEALCNKYSNIKVLKTSFDLPTVKIHQCWHKTNTSDPAHKWLRNYIQNRLNNKS